MTKFTRPATRARTYGKTDLTMHAHKLDQLDVKILAQLQRKGRISNVALAKSVSLSPPPCLRRWATLEHKGYIKGYHAAIDAKRLGFVVECFVSVRLIDQTVTAIRSFEQKVSAWPVVRECYSLTGNVDFLLKCVARDLESLQGFVINELMREAIVTGVKSSIVVKISKCEPGVPLEQNT